MDKGPNDTSPQKQQKRLEIAVRHTISGFGCRALKTYTSVRSQMLHLTENVFVVKGDLGVIDRVAGHEIDCLAFPTSGMYSNPRVGVAGRVHERAGPQLDAMLCTQKKASSVRHVDSVLGTPGFESGVHLLVHCIGPVYAGYHPNKSSALLYDTYRNALAAIHNDPVVTCAAFASISTGILRFPVKRAAKIALRAVRDTMLERDFATKIAFVCLDTAVLTAFQRAQCKMLRDLRTARYHLASTA
ncbi:Macro domain-containing protein, partial [Globisporangium splendens]